MKKKIAAKHGGRKAAPGPDKREAYARLFRRFVFLTMACSIAPLLLAGTSINLHYTRTAKARLISLFQARTDHHRKIIELFMKECCEKLKLLAGTHSLDFFLIDSNLNNAYELINREYQSITDLGIIDGQGVHLAYIGPFDLLGINYSREAWFKNVMQRGIYISDMFMGFRKKPHFIVAVLRSEGDRKWILRATIDTKAFRSLVENVKIGRSGEVFLLNKEGVFQTRPRFSGEIMARSALPVDLEDRKGIHVDVVKAEKGPGMRNFPDQLVSRTWLADPEWLLMVKQNYSEAFIDVNRTNYAILGLLLASAFLILIVSVFITKYMIDLIRGRDNEAARLNRQLIQAGKMAAIGELSAGVAHEINNPLAIILTEKQILLDSLARGPVGNGELEVQLKISLQQIDTQVKRCKYITHNLLHFTRRTKSEIGTININTFISEVVGLMEREAKASGILFSMDLESGLPEIRSDSSLLQQIFLNLISNSIDAHGSKPYGAVRIRSRVEPGRRGIEVTITDTGSGITPENLEKIFDPFFTTKPAGKGTGLGLSICYSIIKQLGGDISVKSEPEKGTEFILFLPLVPPPDLVAQVHEEFEM